MLKRISLLARSDLSSKAVIAGYIFGLFLPMIIPSYMFGLPNFCSVLLEEDPIIRLIEASCIQAILPIFILFFAFIPYSSTVISAALFTRAALASFSCTALSLDGASAYLYILHALSGICVIYLSWACAQCTFLFSNQKAPFRDASTYAQSVLYFAGWVFITVFLRQVALAFI